MEPVRVLNQTNLIEAGSDIGMVLQSADGKILACNPAAEQLLGYSAAQLIGTTSFDSLWQTIHPDDEYPPRAALRTGKPCLDVTVGAYKPNGELIWLSVSSHPLFQADATTPYAVMTAFSAIGEVCGRDAEKGRRGDSEKMEMGSQSPSPLEQLKRSGGLTPKDALRPRVPASPRPRVFFDELTCQEIAWQQLAEIEAILGFTTDITNRKQAEATLRQSEERYRYLAESIPQLVWTANAQGVLLDLNQRWLDFTGLTFAQAQTEGWEAIVHPDDLPILSQKWAAAAQDGSRYQAEGRIRRADGTYRWHLHQAIALKDEQNQIVKWFGTATDIEDQKQLSQQRDRLLQQEQVAREKAEQANRIKDEFLAVLSHELRSPLNPILGWSRLLQTRKLNATKTAEALTIIERNAKLQAQLIEDLLDVSRILRGKLTLTIAPVNLAHAIAAALETVQLAAQAKDIQIQIDLDSNIGMVSGDAGRLQQIIWNLLSNAVKFTPQGGRVEVKLKKLQMEDFRLQIERELQIEKELQMADCRLQIENKNTTSNLQSAISNLKLNKSEISNLKSEISYALIQVIDTGKGINPDFLPYVFEHFRQEDSATTRKFGGLGLGLAIVRQLVELHGGTVFAESQGEGNGATFTVRLPLIEQQSKKESEPDRSSEYITQSSPLAGLKIIVVDDDADSRDFIAFVLEQDGAEVIALPSALEVLREFPGAKPDVLVSDIGMPEMDGYMLMRQIRALPPAQGGKVPAIALTAYAGEGDSKQALSAGFQQHIAKPIEPNQLVQAIAKLAGELPHTDC